MRDRRENGEREGGKITKRDGEERKKGRERDRREKKERKGEREKEMVK